MRNRRRVGWLGTGPFQSGPRPAYRPDPAPDCNRRQPDIWRGADAARNDLRAFWRRDPGQVPDLSLRLLGSPVQHDTPVATWLHSTGREMEEADWQDADLRLFGLWLDLPAGAIR